MTTPSHPSHACTVSIGIPVYNGENFIREALRSLIAQTFSDFEVVISDNCSTDRTQAICREYALLDSRFSYFRHEYNVGAFNNFKFVLESSRGKYFMWLACDDFLSNAQYLSQLVSMLHGCDYAFPEVDIVDSRGCVLRSRQMLPFSGKSTRFEFALASCSVNSLQVYALYNRMKLLNEGLPYLERFQYCPNYGEGLFVHFISSRWCGAFVADAVKAFRVHPLSVSQARPSFVGIKAFVYYSVSSLTFFMCEAQFNYLQRLRLIIALGLRHLRHISLLLGSILLRYP